MAPGPLASLLGVTLRDHLNEADRSLESTQITLHAGPPQIKHFAGETIHLDRRVTEF